MVVAVIGRDNTDLLLLMLLITVSIIHVVIGTNKLMLLITVSIIHVVIGTNKLMLLITVSIIHVVIGTNDSPSS